MYILYMYIYILYMDIYLFTYIHKQIYVLSCSLAPSLSFVLALSLRTSFYSLSCSLFRSLSRPLRLLVTITSFINTENNTQDSQTNF